MSVCDVENGLPEKRMNVDESSQESGLKRMPVPEEQQLGKLEELKQDQPSLNGQPSPQEFESSEPTIKKEEEEREVKEEETSDVKVDEVPQTQGEKPPTPPAEEMPQPIPSTVKEEVEAPVPAPCPVASAPAEELSRKRSIEKENEGEGSSGSDSDSSRKKNRTERETETQPTNNIPNGNSMPPAEDERERMISDFVAEVSVSTDSVTAAADRLAKEVENLAELAAAKELEWNAILRVKKLKEEMLERVLRRKRMNHFDEQFNSDLSVPDLSNKGIPGGMQFPLRHPRLAEMNKLPQRPILPKPVGSPFSPTSIGREGRNGPIVDVKSIIDDYRSRHPESPARRGRRVRGVAPSEQRFPTVNPSLISMANMALGTGASVRTVSDHVNYMPIGGVEQGRGEPKEPTRGAGKPYPEVTLHPVSPPSLLHQVLTKSAPPRPANFSPTLARLLTAPERPSPPPHFRPPSRVSIADILSSTKLKHLKATKQTCKNYPSIVMALLTEDDEENEEDENDSNEEANGLEDRLEKENESNDSVVYTLSKKEPKKIKPRKIGLEDRLEKEHESNEPKKIRSRKIGLEDRWEKEHESNEPVVDTSSKKEPKKISSSALSKKDRLSQSNGHSHPKESPPVSKSCSSSQDEGDTSTRLSAPPQPVQTTKLVQIQTKPSQSGASSQTVRHLAFVPKLKLTSSSTKSPKLSMVKISSPITLNTGKTSQKEDDSQSSKTEELTGAILKTIRPNILKRPSHPSSQALSSTDSSDRAEHDRAPKPKKSRNEITITPVSGNPGTKSKEDIVCLDDDDGDSGALVIDEGADDIPTCQGCRTKSAQFVCAGCGNQWYCSRECQVSAWEEHSDMCSG